MTYDTVTTVLLVMLLRFGLPILMTALIVYGLRRLDKRWQEQARNQTPVELILATTTPCWEVNNCSADTKYHCSAFLKPEVPCFQQFRAHDGRVKEKCLGCSVYREATVPVTA